MRTTSKIPINCGGAMVITYDSKKKEFENDLGQMMAQTME